LGISLRKKIVISAINFTEGGPLRVLKDFLDAAVNYLGPEWDIVALVNNKNLFDIKRVQFIDFTYSKKSWLIRIFYEWIFFWLLSKKLKADLWFSFHDITPNVIARRQSVYCHNPAPFYNVSFKETLLEPSLYLFSKLYQHIYRIGIEKNYHVVVQQDWLRKEFSKNFHIKNIVVANPIPNKIKNFFKPKTKSTVVFTYPALPRAFKNFEVICEAANILTKNNIFNFEVRLTIDGSENRYSYGIVKKYSRLSVIKFTGKQDNLGMHKLYTETGCLVFPSKLETWGLPITEAKRYKIPMILADLPYAREAVGEYDRVKFFPSLDAMELSKMMLKFINSNLVFEHTISNKIDSPFAKNWNDLVKILVKGL
jgi:glycosyltransferase involved in cell wall biosynthesis